MKFCRFSFEFYPNCTFSGCNSEDFLIQILTGFFYKASASFIDLIRLNASGKIGHSALHILTSHRGLGKACSADLYHLKLALWDVMVVQTFINNHLN